MLWTLADFRSFWRSPARHRWARVFCKPPRSVERAARAVPIRRSAPMTLMFAPDLTNFGDLR